MCILSCKICVYVNLCLDIATQKYYDIGMEKLLLIKNVCPLVEGNLLSQCDILIKGNKIASIMPQGAEVEGAEVLEGNGDIIAAGYIDIHTHGGYGHDMMEATEEALDKISTFHLDNGITTYIPTTLTASIPDTRKALDALLHYNRKDVARRYGAHLEGPYLSRKAAGAHPPHLLLSPDEENSQFIRDYNCVVSRITMAPDISGVPWCTAMCVENGIQVSLGHDQSIDDEIDAAIEAGATSVTHLYNCTSRPSRRENPKKHLGLTELGLIYDDITCEVIADNRHVPNRLFGMIYKLKGADRIALVSDSLSVAGMSEGEYFLGSGESKQHIRIEDGVATLPSENTYAGSITPISKMVTNLYASLDISAADCIRMATLTPAKLMNMTDRGDIKEGYLADLNILDEHLTIKKTILDGEVVREH